MSQHRKQLAQHLLFIKKSSSYSRFEGEGPDEQFANLHEFRKNWRSARNCHFDWIEKKHDKK